MSFAATNAWQPQSLGKPNPILMQVAGSVVSRLLATTSTAACFGRRFLLAAMPNAMQESSNMVAGWQRPTIFPCFLYNRLLATSEMERDQCTTLR